MTRLSRYIKTRIRRRYLRYL